MTAVHAPSGAGMRATVRATLRDGRVLARRNVRKMQRVPDIVVFALIQPVMFVLLFAYVFGSAFTLPGISYREFLMAGIFTQTVAFGSSTTAVGLATDLHRGMVERLRTLPIANGAVLLGRTTADLGLNVAVTVMLVGCGYLVGWRIRSGFVDATVAFAVLLLFAYTMSWISAWIGLSVRSIEVAQSAGMIWLFPFTFLSAAFVPTSGMPRGLRAVADWNPITAVTTVVRTRFGNTSDAMPLTSWPDRHALALSLLWCVLGLVVFVPLSVRRYRIATSR